MASEQTDPKTLSSGIARMRFAVPALVRQSAVGRAIGLAPIETPPISEDLTVISPVPRPRASGYFISFIGMVVLPALVAAVYFAFLAADQYVAEARFAVRKSHLEMGRDNKISNVLSALSGGSSGGMADQEAHIVANYLRNRTAIDDVSTRLDVKAIFQRPEADFWSRLKKDPSAEELSDYWRTMVSSYVDGPSGVVTVTARAFRPEDAKQLVQEFITSSESLVNRLSERARQDAMRKAEDEVRRTEATVRQALQRQRQYRDEEGFISPQASATNTSTLLLEAMSERIKLHNDLFVASRAMSPGAPTLLAIKARIESLDSQIYQLKAQLTAKSSETRSVSSSLVRYEELELQRIFAEKMYSLSQDALERARLRAEQQMVYISVFVPPHLPQEARFPERITMSVLIAISLLLVWGMIALTTAAIEDHTL